jgi:ABC-type lipoprotein export system ATPase subunit
MTDDQPILTNDSPLMRRDVVLSLRDVCCRETTKESVKLRDVNLEVCQGDLVMIRLGRRQNPRAFSSMIQGLSHPLSGQVLFEQKSWLQTNIEQQFYMRSRIGRVFDGRAWINNLNVTENVTLRAQHHAFPAAKLQQQIDGWSNRLGVPELTRERPAFVEASVLQQYQWLRALIGDPLLVILERPMKTLDSDKIEPLVNSINEIRNQSAAVIWFAGSDYETEQAFSGNVSHYQFKDGNLIPDARKQDGTGRDRRKQEGST